MENLRIVGLVVAAGFATYGIAKYRRGKWAKFDLLLALVIATGIAGLSVFPQVGNALADFIGFENRLFASIVFAILLLYGLFLYLLNQVRIANRKSGEIVRAFARHLYHERYFVKRKPLAGESGSPSKGKLLIIIPAYNEQDAIRGVLAKMPRELLGFEVDTLVVVDGSTDATEAVAIEHELPVATHIVNRGQGDALRTGFEIARMEQADIVVNMDADGQHRPEEIERLVRPIVDGEADFVMGSRFLGHYEESGGARHIGIVLFSRLISLLSRVRITDCTNGFRAIRGRDLNKLELREDRFSTAELILEAAKKGLRIREVPVSILKRAQGESKKPKRLAYPLGFLRVILQTWLR